MRNLTMAALALGALTLSLTWPATSLAKSYRIGASLPLSGAQKSEGQAMKLALELYIESINAGGGINKVPLELTVKDDANDPAKAKANAAAFAADSSVLVVIGHQFSSVALAAGEEYEKGKLPHISPSASNPAVTKDRPYVFSMNYQDVMQGQSMAVYLKAVVGARRVAIIHADSAYGRGLRESFAQKASRIGLQLSGAFEYKQAQPLADDFAEKNKRALDVDAIVVFSRTEEGAKLIRQIRGAGIDAPVFGPDSFTKKIFIEALGPFTDNVLIAGPFLYELASLKTKQFSDTYTEKYKEAYGAEPTVWAAFSYDALDLVVHSLRANKGNVSRENIRSFLATVRDPESSIQGISGKLYFSREGAMQRQIVVSMIEDFRFKPAFTQIREVIEPHVLANLEPRLESGDVVDMDDVPYYLTRVVYAGLDFYRINSVDVAGQNFDIEFFLWYRYVGNVDTTQIDFLNGIYGVEDKTEVLRKDFSRDVKYICYKIKGTYLTPYDLRLFPFDVQALPMTLSHKTKDATQLMLVVDNKNLSHAKLKAIYPEEWRYKHRVDYSGTYEEHSTFGDPSYTGGASKVDFSIYQTNIVIKRILFPYLVTLFMPLVIMIVISLFVFLIPRDQFDARMTLVMTALLSVLVFHLSQGESLPNVGYLIKADQFFMAAYVLIFALIMKTIGVNLFLKYEKATTARRIDRTFAMIFTPATIIVYIWLTIHAVVSSSALAS